MSSKPVIFISAVSQELKSARQLVANTLIYLGYEPDWQDIFGTEQGDLREMLRRRIDASAGVVQLIGQCSGFEPGEPDAEFGRCSYTQFEVFYARQRGKKVWLLFLDDTYPADAHDPPPDEWRELQRAYRERMRAGSELYHPIKTPAELETATLKLRQELAELRRRAKRWAAAVLLLLVLVIGGVTWLKSGQHGQTQTLTVMSQEQNQQTQALTVLNQGQNQQTQALTVMSQEQQKMRQILRDLPQTLAQLKSPEEKEDDDAPQARAFAVLEKKYAFPRRLAGHRAAALCRAAPPARR